VSCSDSFVGGSEAIVQPFEGEKETMFKHFLIAAVLGLFLGSGAISQANAASFTASGIDAQISDATGGSALTQTNGGWWVVPAVVGGVLLYHHIHRHHHHYYYRCYRHCYWHHGHRHCYRRC
jgi:hypothetical protein